MNCLWIEPIDIKYKEDILVNYDIPTKHLIIDTYLIGIRDLINVNLSNISLKEMTTKFIKILYQVDPTHPIIESVDYSSINLMFDLPVISA